MIDQVHAIWSDLELMGSDNLLCIDQTGVGRPIVDLFLRRAEIACRTITITGGATVSDFGDGSYNVPKRDLASVLQILLRTRRLQIAQALPEAALLLKELQNFRVKITQAGGETYEAWRTGQHDDLVLAVALPCWLGERVHLGAFSVGTGGGADSGRSLFADVPGGVFDGRDDNGERTLWEGGR
jgi:hypothetical protein